ncbi:MAG: type II toxin-antitoxin system VapC family toxin [Anabaena sp. CoA2_C59]|jgi:PIN domain nuclease of toxin-antitoxin system|uniref:type II toxin-antitoxin system VapC family toxin n=1 Tax=Dolichospermum TaxID=748770 RepID=UPI0004098623|nr:MULTISPECIES: type II toxin-antitoxin system VapC family toxin [Dolichospermum]MBO1062981.1 type II toxin-antitoxin system VapC family toxin [Aphanizomenon flos-aquae CP01]MCE2720169.1 type II toxin-antitoxin system VapC family toxin [Anabaena sp. 49628_E55]MCE2906125.1 type II toxin-antitoxin system VapC family toxin [Anabaena sp. CoA2_C59]MDJ0504050.1 type II toxin-antitoxin system VapC family toxin [Nostocales cyanobacterium LE14-WE12]NTW20148.1 type II toxin-antitoxin system VapC family
MSEVVVDASAILALLNQETGSEEVLRFIGKAAISTVNLSEVIAKLADAGIPEEDIRQILSNLNLEVIDFNKEQALKAGMLRPNTKSIGLSFGDRACLALAIFLNQPVLTTDRLWGSINVGVEVRVVR